MKAYVYSKKRRKLSLKAKIRIVLCIILVILSLFVFYYFKVVAPIVVSLSEEKVRSLSTQVSSAAVGQAMGSGLTYEDLVNIEYNSNNEIVLINTDSVTINKLVRAVTESIQKDMDNLGKDGIDIALGTFTGIPFLYGIGPSVSVKLVPVGTVNTKFNSSFTSAGVNQSLHRLYFVISINVGMVLPYYAKNFLTELEVEICESVILGKVPNVYLQGGII